MTLTVMSGRADLAVDIDGREEGDEDDGRARLTADPRPPVLFVHADVADRRVWRALAAALADTHRGVAYDRRGFGQTTSVPEPWSEIDDAVAVLDAAAADRAVVVGNSGGGKVALDLALARPDRVAALVLVAPAVRGAPEADEATFEPALEVLSAALDAADEAGDLDQVNRLEAHIWLDGPDAPEGRVGGMARALFLDMNGVALASPDPGPEIEPPPAWGRLEEVAVPTLVAVGELDLPHVIDRATLVAEQIPGARLVGLPRVAHVPMLEGSPELVEAIRDFLGDLAS